VERHLKRIASWRKANPPYRKYVFLGIRFGPFVYPNYPAAFDEDYSEDFRAAFDVQRRLNKAHEYRARILKRQSLSTRNDQKVGGRRPSPRTPARPR